MDRLAIVHTPLADKLLFRSMRGREGLSSLFHYSVEMVSLDGNIDLNSLLGQSLSLQVKQLHAPDHWLNGDIISMELKGQEGGSSRYYVYKADVYPRLWYLGQNKDFRIFQEQNVPSIVSQILADYNITVDNRIYGDYRNWGYCVQYNESSLDFISRLMEHEGIYYYFTHLQDQHTLVLADSPEAHQPIAYPLIPYRGPEASALADEICIDNWQVSSSVTASKVSMDDYNFHKPYATLFDVKNNAVSHAIENTEVFEWPGRFIDREHAQAYNEIRQQEQAAYQQKMVGSATTCMMTPGGKMTVIKSARQEDNREYLITQSTYSIWDNSYASGTDAKRGQASDFYAIPSSTPWRTPRTTPWPKTQGPQTARVVCPEGETIWTDKYGRVKVKFHWDRYAKGDDTSSCWIRVASSWAGQGFGAVQIPRLNDEVVVDFINGDPDRPLIIGRVYNEANMPPWDLPANATQMGFFSRSKKGHKETANALRFEDKLGEEEVWIHAEKDMNTDIENNETLYVNVDRNKTIGQDETNHIKRNRTETVDADEKITIHGQRQEEVDGDEIITIHTTRTETVDSDETVNIGGNRSKTVVGNDTLTVQGNQAETVLIAKAETIGAAKALSIGAAYQITVGGLMNTSVGLEQAEEIGLNKTVLVNKNYKQVVGKNKMVVIRQDMVENITKNREIHIGKNFKIVAGDKIEIKCGKSVIRMSKDGKVVIDCKELVAKTSSKQAFKAGGNITIKGKNIKEN